MKVTELLAEDHRRVQELLGRIERGEAGVMSDEADTAIRELSVHAAAEELVVYPAVLEMVPTGETLTGNHIKEHQLAKEVLAAIERGSEAERTALFASLAAYVRHHVDHEETKLFKALEDHATPEVLEQLGRSFEDAKATAPTHPHPHGPSTSPANIPANAAAALVDRVRDAIGST